MYAMSKLPTQDAYLRLPDVIAVTGLGRSTIFRRIKLGEFPRQYDLGGHIVGWRRSEIDKWLSSRQLRNAPS